ncbi:MAG: hypothetical protein LBL59_08905 [Xanthomonadaceae bacterium]|nr:hypothetical protein [Xanthomonadaceae bacterium]
MVLNKLVWELLLVILVVPVILGVVLSWILRRRAKVKGEELEAGGWTGPLIVIACWVTAMIVILIKVF